MAHKYRIHPNYITQFWERPPRKTYIQPELWDKREKKEDGRKNLNRGFRQNQTISIASQNRIRDAADWLELIAEEKCYTSKKGRKFYHRLQMLTMTVPSQQGVTDKEIMQNLFQPFLDNLRQNYGLTNYIWRAEAQDRGELHFHLLTDCPLGYWVILKIWNARLEKLGLLKEFRASKKKKKGAKSKFKYFESYPNSVDIKRFPSSKRIGDYLGKYISKRHKGKEPRRLGVRHYGLSYSLSRLKQFRQEFEDLAELIYHHAIILPGVQQVKKEWSSYIPVQLKRIFGIWRFIRDEVKKSLREFCKLEPSPVRENRITTTDQLRLYFGYSPG